MVEVGLMDQAWLGSSEALKNNILVGNVDVLYVRTCIKGFEFCSRWVASPQWCDRVSYGAQRVKAILSVGGANRRERVA